VPGLNCTSTMASEHDFKQLFEVARWYSPSAATTDTEGEHRDRVTSASDDWTLKQLGFAHPGAIILGGLIAVAVAVLAMVIVRIASRRDTPMGRMLSFSVKEAKLLIPATFLLFLNSGLLLLMPYFGGQFVQLVSTDHGSLAQLDSLLWELVIIASVSGVVQAVRGFLFMLAGERIVKRLRDLTFDAMIKQEIAYFDEQQSGTLVSRLITDTTIMQEAAAGSLSMAVRTASNILLCLIVMLIMSWSLTLTMFATAPALAMMVTLVSKASDRMSKVYQERIGKLAEVASEAFSNHRTVRSFANGQHFMEMRWSGAAADVYRSGRGKSLIGAIWTGCSFFVFWLGFAVVLRFGASHVLEGRLSHGQLVAFVLYTINMSGSMMFLGGLVPFFTGALGCTAKVFEVLAREPAIVDGDCFPARCSGLVEFCAVTFFYPARPDVKVLKEISFTVEPAGVTAIVGQSGSGKSSCMSLIQRIYDATDGCIKIDGVDVKELRYAFLRQHIAVVSQEPVLFAISCEENILFGIDEECSSAEAQDRLLEASNLANSHAFISNFPDKYKTMVGEKGLQLSGGQKQRIAIARALLVKPTILLLDEATSALDAESEGLVQGALDKLFAMKAYTSVVVAHRLSTVKNADKIIVLEGGCVLEAGTHNALVAQDGVYRNLVHSQLMDKK